jgi:hypothetical protein
MFGGHFVSLNNPFQVLLLEVGNQYDLQGYWIPKHGLL